MATVVVTGAFVAVVVVVVGLGAPLELQLLSMRAASPVWKQAL